MERFIMKKLKQWKASDYRKPIILEGAYRVGKTWLMKRFGENEYEDMLYIDFRNVEDKIRKLFSARLNTEKLFSGLKLIFEKEIKKADTLIIFDEIQEMPEILWNIRYFYEEDSEYHIICASSKMDIASYAEFPFPMEKVEFLKLYPMSFQEFFWATKQEESYKKFFDTNNFNMMNIFEENYIEVLKLYYFVGGMPEAVLCFVETGDLNRVRDMQKNILKLYEQFASSHTSPALFFRINKVWRSIPSQLEKKNKKFMYGLMQEGDRAKFYEEAIAWLDKYGFVHKVNRITQPVFPLKAYENTKAYKLFAVDIGLLGCMFGLSQDVLLRDDELFDKFGGALTEQYVLQQMKVFSDWNIHYYANERCACEINFLIDNGRIIVPVDVRMKVSSKAKRLRTYQSKFHPEKSVQISMEDYCKESQLLHLPLYAVEKMIPELGI